MTKQILHFTVHPNILNMIRQAYWYEGRKDWAMDCMKSIGEEMTLKLADQLLGGDAHFITEDEGKTLTVVFKEEKKFKKELKKHLKFLQKRKEDEKKEIKRIQKEQEKKYLIQDTIVIPIQASKEMQKKVIKKQIEFQAGVKESDADYALRIKHTNDNLARKFRLKAMMEKDPEQRKILMELNQTFSNKVFEFVFRGKHYTAKDSARCQSHCPHCDAMGSSGVWNPEDDKKAFIGIKKLGQGNVAVCFECPKCFEKFFYHNREDSLTIQKIIKKIKVKQ